MKRLSLLAQFSLLSFVVLAIFGMALGWAMARFFESQELQREMDATASLMGPAVGPFITKDILANGAHGKDYQAIEDAFRYIGGAGLVRVKIWNKNGMVVYSDQPELVGRTYPLSDEIE